jgi:hypothetical protein
LWVSGNFNLIKYFSRLKDSPDDVFEVQITGDSSYKNCRVWINILNRNDGSFIVRYKTYHTCYNFKIHVTYKGVHVASSPYIIKGKLMLLRTYRETILEPPTNC